MKKFYLLIISFILLSVETKAQTYIGFNNGVELTTYDGCEIVNADLNLILGVHINSNSSFETDGEYGFKRNDINHFRIGFNYVYNIKMFYAKVGLGFKSYKLHDDYNEYYDSDIDLNGCDFKVGLGFNILLNNKLCLTIGMDVTNMVNNDIKSWKNTMIHPRLGITFDI